MVLPSQGNLDRFFRKHPPICHLDMYKLGYQLPIHYVYLMVMTEEVVKVSLGLIRFVKGRWIHALTTA